jgi:hypothetical protein
VSSLAPRRKACSLSVGVALGAVELPCAITGIQYRSAQCILAEIGADISAFASLRQLASWAGQCAGQPTSRPASGAPARSATPRGDYELEEAAMAAIRVKANYLAVQYQRLKPRRGHKKSLGAVKHRTIILRDLAHALDRCALTATAAGEGSPRRLWPRPPNWVSTGTWRERPRFVSCRTSSSRHKADKRNAAGASPFLPARVRLTRRPCGRTNVQQTPQAQVAAREQEAPSVTSRPKPSLRRSEQQRLMRKQERLVASWLRSLSVRRSV